MSSRRYCQWNTARHAKAGQSTQLYDIHISFGSENVKTTKGEREEQPGKASNQLTNQSLFNKFHRIGFISSNQRQNPAQSITSSTIFHSYRSLNAFNTATE